MLTSNIKFKNFKNIKSKKIKNFKKEKWFNEIKLFGSLKKNYKYSYSKNQINKSNKIRPH